MCDEPGGAIPPLKLTQIANGLDLPLFVTSEPGDAGRLYVVEQRGRIRLIKNGVLQPEPFLDISAIVQQVEYQQDERGLLGLAFHPDYAQNGRFFVYYNDDQGSALTLAEFSRSAGDPDTANGAPDRVFFTVTDGLQGNHNGGMLAFGPDGLLYVGIGDGGGSGDPNNHGQNINIKLGKILRVNVDTYPDPPPGNLPGGDPDIWDYGLRNPWRFSFDRCNGDLYIGDVGQNEFEEIDIERAGEGNKNYGWSVMEGTGCFKPAQAPGCDDPSLVPPVTEYTHSSNDGCSVNGGYVYRGSAIPALRGTYLYGDFCSNRIWSLVWKDGALLSEGELSQDLDSTGQLQAMSSFGEDAAGDLYVVDLAGSVYRIDPE
ncbi:MAG: PQQ-dependent sugar dehydrogenase [Polyangiaceae bacterium]|nr:PQQ-dependent sugar dehydrogenase [Polyangiaceae bacterium]